MRRSIDLTETAGWLCLLATLVTSAPGVKAVRADEPRPVESAGPVCEQGVAEVRAQAAALEQLRAAAIARAERGADPEADAVVPLGNRGFNEGPDPDAQIGRVLQQIQREQ